MDINAEDSHFKEIIYQMNRVKVADTIKQEDEEKLKGQGYTSNVGARTPSDEEFRELYPNASYAAFDVSKMRPDRIMELANKYFPKV